MMPGLDGFETCASLRTLASARETPIIFLTARDDDEAHRQALAAGADDFLVKPIRKAELVIRVRALLRLRETTLELEAQRDLAREKHEALQTLQRQKDELASLIIHDLKTPLATLTLETEFALESVSEPSELRDSLSSIDESVATLRRMVMDLLDIGRAESGALTLHRAPVDLKEMVERVASSAQRRILAKQQHLELRVESGMLDVDRELFRRVLENLVDNACKHTKRGGRIVIEATRKLGHLRLDVLDQGPGIPEEARARVFDKYVQLDDQRHDNSRGLGLTFCKLAVEAHGGQIWVADNDGGCRFCIDLAWPAA